METDKNRHLRLVSLDFGKFVVRSIDDVPKVWRELDLANQQALAGDLPILRLVPRPEPPDEAA